MGPNGAGKSTLSYVLGGRPGYEVTEGSVMFAPSPCHPRESGDPGATLTDATLGPRFRGDDKGELDLLALDPHDSAAAGLFLGFPYPVELTGFSHVQFLRESLTNRKRLV